MSREQHSELIAYPISDLSVTKEETKCSLNDNSICNLVVSTSEDHVNCDSDATTSVTINDLVGPFGWWQFNIAAFYFCAYTLTTLNYLGASFHAAKTNFHCLNWTNNSELTIIDYDRQQCDQCVEWAFDNSIGFEETIISEYQLNCGLEWLSSFSQSVYQVGYVASGIIISYLSDSHGRYRALCTALLLDIVGGVLLIMSNSIYMYIAARFVLGFGDSGSGMCLYMLILETVSKKHRTDAVLGTSFGWVVGFILLPGIAHVLRNYRYLQMVSTVIMLLMIIFWLPHLPESPRWLLTKRRYKEAYDELHKASKQNGTFTADFDFKFDALKVDTTQSTKLKGCSEEKRISTVWNLLCSPQYRVATLILWFSFCVNGFIYHGFNLNVDILGGDVYLNFALAGLIEIPSMMLNFVGMRFSGRKSFTIATILSSTICYSTIVVAQLWWPDSDHWAIITFSMLGKMFLFSTYNGIYIHAGEIFPTQLRHSGVSSCSIAARFGSTIAPFVRELAASVGLMMTMLIFSSMTIITAFMTVFLPETKDQELVDRIE